MQPVLNVEDVRSIEVALDRGGVSLAELMARAGASAAQEVVELGDVSDVVVFVGLGNNGGDGWVASEVLLAHGISPTVVCPVEPDRIPSDLARQAARSAVEAGVTVVVEPTKDEVADLVLAADVVLDCMLGTGFHGEVRAPFDTWIDCVNASGAHVIAVDVPSGLSAQTGQAASSCIAADATVTMLALKPGLVADDGRDACGAIVVDLLADETERLAGEVDPVAWRPDFIDYLPVLPVQTQAVDKFSRGSVLVVGGSVRFSGAPIMAAKAAARMGAGYVTLAVPASVVPIAQAHLLEIPVVGLPEDASGVVLPEAAEVVCGLASRSSAVLVGPGMCVCEGTKAVVSALLDLEVPLVVDADGLNSLARIAEGDLSDRPDLTRRLAPLVLTPHRRELGRLVGRSDNPPASLVDQIDAARAIVWANGGSELVVVAKGTATACVDINRALLPKPGPSALATAGSGDVLSGMMAAALAKADSEADLALLAAYVSEVHGQAGAIAAEQRGSRGVVATDIIEVIGIAADAVDEQVGFSGLVFED